MLVKPGTKAKLITKVEMTEKSKIDILPPEPQPNSELKADATSVRPAIAKPHVVRSAFSVRADAVSELYNMDCVSGMKHYPDKYFDLAICDPPYGIGLVRTEAGNWGLRKGTGENNSKEFDWDFKKPTKEYIVELFRVSKNQILFGANHYIEVVPYNSSCWLVWDKDNGRSYFADCELAWTSFQTATRKIKLQYFGANSHRFGKRIHSTQKPVSLYKFILENYAEKGMKILDTHLGSGSSRIAAYELGFDFVSFEIDEKMCVKQEKRFKEHLSQKRMSF